MGGRREGENVAFSEGRRRGPSCVMQGGRKDISGRPKRKGEFMLKKAALILSLFFGGFPPFFSTQSTLDGRK